MEFSGKAPDIGTTTNYTFLLTGYDPSDNWNTTTFTIEVTPNGICQARENKTLVCEEKTWCSYSIEMDNFVEPNQDELTIFLTNQITVSWLQYSSINHTIFGWVNFLMIDPLELEFLARDPFDGECTMTVTVSTTENTEP